MSKPDRELDPQAIIAIADEYLEALQKGVKIESDHIRPWYRRLWQSLRGFRYLNLSNDVRMGVVAVMALLYGAGCSGAALASSGALDSQRAKELSAKIAANEKRKNYLQQQYVMTPDFQQRAEINTQYKQVQSEHNVLMASYIPERGGVTINFLKDTSTPIGGAGIAVGLGVVISYGIRLSRNRR